MRGPFLMGGVRAMAAALALVNLRRAGALSFSLVLFLLAFLGGVVSCADALKLVDRRLTAAMVV